MYDPPASKLMTLVDAAEYLGLTRSALLKAAKSGTLWTIKPGNQRYTTREMADIYRQAHANYIQSERMKDIIQKKSERMKDIIQKKSEREG